MNLKCPNCGIVMKLMRVSPDCVKWRDAFVCDNNHIACGIKELDEVLPSWQDVSESIEKADSEHCSALEQNAAEEEVNNLGK